MVDFICDTHNRKYPKPTDYQRIPMPENSNTKSNGVIATREHV